jgi:hypothetical protein
MRPFSRGLQPNNSLTICRRIVIAVTAKREMSNLLHRERPFKAPTTRVKPSGRLDQIVRFVRKIVGASGFEPPTPRSRTEV